MSAPARPRTRLGDVRPALARQRRHRRRRRVTVLLVVGLVLLVGTGLGWLIGWSSVLTLREVRVTGTELLPPEQVVSAAQAPTGRPLARVDTDLLRQRVAALGPVAEARVGRAWPHAVTVEVTERTPVLVVQTEQGEQLVDASGTRWTSPVAPAELPDDPVPAQLAETLGEEERPALLQDLATVVAALPAPLRAEVEQVSAASADTIELELSSDRAVEWGSAADSALKAEVLTVMLDQADVEIWNVSVPSHPTVR